MVHCERQDFFNSFWLLGICTGEVHIIQEAQKPIDFIKGKSIYKKKGNRLMSQWVQMLFLLLLFPRKEVHFYLKLALPNGSEMATGRVIPFMMVGHLWQFFLSIPPLFYFISFTFLFFLPFCFYSSRASVVSRHRFIRSYIVY